MRVKKYFSIAVVTIFMLICAIMGIVTYNVSPVRADGSSFKMDKGAYIRLVDGDEADYGIKFSATIPANECAQDDEFYVMIIPSVWLQKYDLTEEDCDYFDVLVNDNGMDWEGDDRDINIMKSEPVLKDDTYHISGSITNIKYGNSFREFCGIVYKQSANGTRQYAELNDNQRSISQVASMALNDSETTYKPVELTYLNKMVKNAYNAKNGKIATDEQDNLPTVSSAIKNMTVSNGTAFDLRPTGLPEDIGIDVVYNSNNTAAVSIDENGLATAKADSGTVTVSAKALGVTYTNTVTLRPAMAANMLEDFNSELSANNVQWNVYGTCDGSGSGSWWPVTYHETFQGATGVVEIQGHAAGAAQTPLRFNRTEKELLEILKKSESITYKMRSAEAAWMTPAGWTNGFVLNASDGWKDVTVTKEQLLSGTTLEAFCKAHCNTGSGLGNTFGRANNGPTIYIDSITFNEVAPAIELASYTAPTTAGGRFNLPTATLKKGDLVMDDAQITVKASVNVPKPAAGGTPKADISLNVADISGVKNIKVHSGTTTVTYTCVYQGQTYTESISYTISSRAAMASDMLEDFDDAASVYNLSNSDSGSFNPSWWPASEYLDTFQDANGVVKFTAGSDGAKTVKVIFNKTEAELLAIMQTIEKVTFRIYNNTSADKAFYGHNTSTFIKALTANAWTEVTMTKAQLLAGVEGSTEEEKIANFAAMYCKTGTGSKALFMVDKSAEIYIDYISFTSANAE